MVGKKRRGMVRDDCEYFQTAIDIFISIDAYHMEDWPCQGLDKAGGE